MVVHRAVHVSGTARTRAATVPGRPGALWPLLGAMAFLSLGGFYGGLSFIADPSGRALGADPSWLDRRPVGDFPLPGLFLWRCTAWALRR